MSTYMRILFLESFTRGISTISVYLSLQVQTHVYSYTKINTTHESSQSSHTVHKPAQHKRIHTHLLFQLKLSQQEIFLPVNGSSFATLHLFSSKNKQCFAYYLYLAYKWGSGTNFLFKTYFRPHHLPQLTPQHPFFSHHLTCFCVHPLQSPHQNQNWRQGGWRVGPQLATQDLRKNTMNELESTQLSIS